MLNIKLIFKKYILLLTLIVMSCQSHDDTEYEILNLAIDRCIFPPTDIDAVNKISEDQQVSMEEALTIYDSKTRNVPYNYSISDTLYAENLPENVWQQLQNDDIFEMKGRSDRSIPIDFTKIKPLKNRNRIENATEHPQYLGHFKFHRVLTDKSGSYGYIQVEIPKGKGRLHGSFGLQFKKENGKWKILN